MEEIKTIQKHSVVVVPEVREMVDFEFTQYKTADGKIFDVKYEAERHEDHLAEAARLAKLKEGIIELEDTYHDDERGQTCYIYAATLNDLEDVLKSMWVDRTYSGSFKPGWVFVQVNQSINRCGDPITEAFVLDENGITEYYNSVKAKQEELVKVLTQIDKIRSEQV